MYKFKHDNREFRKTLYQEETPFDNWEIGLRTKQESEPKKMEIPKLRLRKRSDIQKEDQVFYLAWLGAAFLSVIWNLSIGRIGNAFASLLAAGITIIVGYFTEPSSWSQARHGLSFWNASVTVGVLLKSIHPELYRFRNIVMWVAVVGVAFGLLFEREFAVFFWGMFLVSGVLVLAARDFELYGRLAKGLAWFLFLSASLEFIFYGILPLVLVFMSITLHQTYERLRNLHIKYPEWLEEG